MDKITFICLAVSTLCEPVFLGKVRMMYIKRLKKRQDKMQKPKIKVGQNILFHELYLES